MCHEQSPSSFVRDTPIGTQKCWWWRLTSTHGYLHRLGVNPSQNDAVSWHNLRPEESGWGNELTLHAGCPVVQGSKWGAYCENPESTNPESGSTSVVGWFHNHDSVVHATYWWMLARHKCFYFSNSARNTDILTLMLLRCTVANKWIHEGGNTICTIWSVFPTSWLKPLISYSAHIVTRSERHEQRGFTSIQFWWRTMLHGTVHNEHQHQNVPSIGFHYPVVAGPLSSCSFKDKH